jgi:heme A synthase
MPDTETPAESRNRRRATAFMVTAVLLLVWSILANQWSDKGCSMWVQSYGLVITHQTPDHFEGCDEYGDYTDDYSG